MSTTTTSDPACLGKDIDARAPVQDIEDHLGRHLPRIGRHPLVDHAVIAREGEDGLLVDDWAPRFR